VIVDIHGHITPPELFEMFPMPPALRDIEGMIQRKLDAGIGLTIVGSPVGFGTMTPVPGFDPYEQSLDRLKAFHEWVADKVREHAPRLAAYVYTNPFGGPAELAQAAVTIKEPGFVGFIINTSIRGEYLDSPRADDFFAMAAELDAPVFLHPPAEPVGTKAFADFRVVEYLGRYLEVAASLAALVFGGRLQRYPSLKVVAATAGGPIALAAGRLDLAARARHFTGGPDQARTALSEPPSAYLRRIYVDTANASLPNHLANLELMGPEHILFGTDSPPLATPLEAALEIVNALPVSEADRAGILHKNAERLFNLAGAGRAQERRWISN
jgi:aminocarboxymuconate-semialdehyde decarboxylase